MKDVKMKLVCVGADAGLIVQNTHDLVVLVVSDDRKSVLAGNLEMGILVTNNKTAILETIKKDAEKLPAAKLLWDHIQTDGVNAIKEVEGIVINASLV